MAELDAAIRALHLVAASLWVGGAVLMAFVLGPSLAKAGAAAGPFMSVVMRRGGLSPFFGTVGTVTVLTGAYIYHAYKVDADPFGGTYQALITSGAILAVLAYLHGLFAVMPLERRIKALVRSMPAAGPPPASQLQQMQALGEKQGKASALSTALLALALLLMASSKAFG